MTDVSLPTPGGRVRRRQRPAAANAARSPARPRALPPLPVTAFIVSLVIPFKLQVGPMLMSANRMVLIAMIVPCFALWLAGRAGRIRIADLALLAMCGWVLISLARNHGLGAVVEPVGIFFIETMGAYLLARCFIRDADTFYAMVRLFLLIILAFMPFAILETMTGRNLLLEIANTIHWSEDDVFKEPRWGLDRVQAIFEHPIHFGVFAGSFIALVYCVWGHGRAWVMRMGATIAVGVTAFLSLSSGPLTSMIGQVMLLGYDRVFKPIRHRWMLLTAGMTSMVVALEVAANRSTPELFIHYFSFNIHTAYNRLRIWEFGSASVAKNPIFGIGFNEWERPEWMTGSMDMFWLVPAVQNGLPAAILLQVAFFAIVLGVIARRMPDQRLADYKLGFVICMVGLYMAGWTVHYWKTIYVLFMFLLASGAWMMSVRQPSSGEAVSEDTAGDRSIRSRRRGAHTGRRNGRGT